MSKDIHPYRIQVPDADLDDLRRRLRATRWPDPEPVDDWSQGIPLAYLKEVCATWADDYDWRKTEARFNAYDQFKAEIDGVGIHFLHVRSKHVEAYPLIVTHGWPGSIVEFLEVIGPLTIPPPTAARRRTPSTSSCRRCPASASPASRRSPAGRWRRSPTPGPS
jgi:hypothetical protein